MSDFQTSVPSSAGHHLDKITAKYMVERGLVVVTSTLVGQVLAHTQACH